MYEKNEIIQQDRMNCESFDIRKKLNENDQVFLRNMTRIFPQSNIQNPYKTLFINTLHQI